MRKEEFLKLKIEEVISDIYDRLDYISFNFLSTTDRDSNTLSVVDNSSTISALESGNLYFISIGEEIKEVLITNLKTRVMRPNYGSELYKLRDREFNGAWRVWATKYTFEAINNHINRVRCKRVYFEVQGDGKIKMNLNLEER